MIVQCCECGVQLRVTCPECGVEAAALPLDSFFALPPMFACLNPCCTNYVDGRSIIFEAGDGGTLHGYCAAHLAALRAELNLHGLPDERGTI